MTDVTDLPACDLDDPTYTPLSSATRDQGYMIDYSSPAPAPAPGVKARLFDIESICLRFGCTTPTYTLLTSSSATRDQGYKVYYSSPDAGDDSRPVHVYILRESGCGLDDPTYATLSSATRDQDSGWTIIL